MPKVYISPRTYSNSAMLSTIYRVYELHDEFSSGSWCINSSNPRCEYSKSAYDMHHQRFPEKGKVKVKPSKGINGGDSC